MKRRHKAWLSARLPVPRLRIRSRQGTTFWPRTHAVHGAAIPQAAPNAVVEFENESISSFASEWRQARKTPMHDITRRDWWSVTDAIPARHSS